MRDLKDELIEKLINGLKDAKKQIRGWHSMGAKGIDEEGMWSIYNSHSPEMKRLNNLIAEAESELATLQVEEQESQEKNYGERLSAGRDFLMTQDPKYLTVEDCLEAFGFTRDGLNELDQ